MLSLPSSSRRRRSVTHACVWGFFDELDHGHLRGFVHAITRARAWGAEWCELSTPFVELVGRRVVAHVGVIELPLLLDGAHRRFAGIHAVCTDVSQRGRGRMRAAMTRALAHVDAHFDGALLWANDPAIYTRFGFVAREESMFVGPVRGGACEHVRPLSLADVDDLALLRAHLARRTSVSRRSDVVDATTLTLIDLALWQHRSCGLSRRCCSTR